MKIELIRKAISDLESFEALMRVYQVYEPRKRGNRYLNELIQRLLRWRGTIIIKR